MLKKTRDFIFSEKIFPGPFFLAALLSLSLGFLLTEGPGSPDAHQNFRMSYNLYSHGTVSLDMPGEDRPPAPTMYREPFPVFVNALFMALHPGIRKNVPYDLAEYGPTSARLKQVNLLWALLGLWGAWQLARLLIPGIPPGMIAMLGSFAFFFSVPLYFNALLSEIPTATLMLWASIALVRAFRGGRFAWWAAAGLLAGCLALTRAAFLYVFPGAFAAALIALSASARVPLKKAALSALVMLVAFSAAVFPWMARNRVLLGSFSIAQRGGVVLLVRAYKNQATREEFRGMFYLWAPSRPARIVLGPLLGFTGKDLMKGGRLNRLQRYRDTELSEKERAAVRAEDPGREISFYHGARAERPHLIRLFEARGMPPSEARIRADAETRRAALNMIRAAPLRHLAMSVPFSWRGMWCFEDYFLSSGRLVLGPLSVTWINLVVYLSVFFLSFQALRRRRQKTISAVLVSFGAVIIYFLLLRGFTVSLITLAAYAVFIFLPFLALRRRAFEHFPAMVLPWGMVAFHVLLTHNIPRYNAPAVPFMIIALMLAVSPGEKPRCGADFPGQVSRPARDMKKNDHFASPPPPVL